MSKTSIFRDIVNSFVSIAKGLWVTVTHWSVLRPSVTELYPEDKPHLPDNYRGMPTLPVDPDTGESPCIACGACSRICPEQVITVIPDKGDPKNRKPASFTIDISRCMWCGLCMEVCPKDCLKPARTFEHACYSREAMVCDINCLMELGGVLQKEAAAEDTEDSQESSGES